MHVFTPVFFNAPLGGLQAHVKANALALLAAGHRCTIMCKPGPFADSMAGLGFTVVPTDYTDVDESVARAQQAGPFDLIHAHPFTSRQVGQELAKQLGIPLILTLHGTAIDSVSQYVHDLAWIICVSTAIRDLVLRDGSIDPARVVVLPNGVDLNVFHPSSHKQPAEVPSETESTQRNVLLVTRLDADKRFVLDCVLETWREMNRTRAFDLHWVVAGDGTQRASLEEAAAELNQQAGRELVRFVGWQSDKMLAGLYNASDLCIAPGRCALESMACATPVIAIGSKGYLGLMDGRGMRRGIYGNFGGVGKGVSDYCPGDMYREIDAVFDSPKTLQALSEASLDVAQTFFAQDALDRDLLTTYRCALMPRSPRTDSLKALPLPELTFAATDKPDTLAHQWGCAQSDKFSISVDPNGALLVNSRLEKDGKFYIASDSTNFALPPKISHQWRLSANNRYQLKLDLQGRTGDLVVQLWVIQYSNETRLQHDNLDLRAGANTLTFAAGPDAESFKIALRFSGAGTASVVPMEFFEYDNDGPGVAPQRTSAPASPDIYQGENLIFVVGPPRSGTTWLLSLLAEHPNVVAATLDNLEVRMNDAPTVETNIFNDNRPFTDAQIRRKFFALSQRHSGKVVVEKTPIHLLFIDRIRSVFPAAALVLMERDGKDLVTSLLHVGRDPQSWWQGAPDNIEAATLLWRRYSIAAQRCKKLQAPVEISYESLHENTAATLRQLLDRVGLSTDHVDEQVEASHAGRNIPIAGVFREGKLGSWKDYLTTEELTVFERIATSGDASKRK